MLMSDMIHKYCRISSLLTGNAIICIIRRTFDISWQNAEVECDELDGSRRPATISESSRYIITLIALKARYESDANAGNLGD